VCNHSARVLSVRPTFEQVTAAEYAAPRRPTWVRAITAATGDRSPTITVNQLTKRYDDRPVAEGLSFSIPMCVVTGVPHSEGVGKEHDDPRDLRTDSSDVRNHAGPRPTLRRSISLPAMPDSSSTASGAPKRSTRNHRRVIAAERSVAPPRSDDVLDLVELTRDTDLPAVDVVHPLRQPSTRPVDR
jgi:hypothetical protein